jgi:methylglutaconyl-CoA hydratase
MNKYDNIEFEVKDGIGTLWLNRPEVRNAFNNHMIADIIDCLESVEHDPEILALVIRGRGKVFCAGADIHWMKSFSKLSYEEDYQENMHLARCFYMIYTFSKPTIAVAHGASFGGGNGLLAACDIAYCAAKTTFSFSEVKIGIIPATISPYVIKRTGEFNARELMLSGKRFTCREAYDKGLVNHIYPEEEIEEALQLLFNEFRANSPQAMASTKELIFNICKSSNFNETIDYTARMIADARASEEGQEGMAAFLEKRKPSWMKKRENVISK